MLYPSAPWRPTTDTTPSARRLTGALLLAAAFAPAVQAQEAELEPITVDSSRIERDLQDTPAAVGVIDEQDATQGRQGLQLDESLVRVPGVFAQNRYNFAQNLRVSIRGFGARSPFGIRGIKLLVDGIPETVVDGQSQSDAIDLTTVENIEVIRGPSSALYGNATGGVIDIDTLSPTDYPLREAAAEYGSFGYNRISARAAEQHDGWGYALSAWNMNYRGYRDQSETEKRLFNGKFNVQLSDDASIETVVRVLDQPLGEDPAGIDRGQVQDDRRQASANAARLDSGQEVDQQTLGVIYEHALSDVDQFTGRVFYTRRDFEQQLPFPGPSLIAYTRDFYGTGLQYTRTAPIAGFANRFTMGVDAEFQSDDRERFLVTAPGGQPGTRTLQQQEEADSIGIYAQNVLSLTDRLDLTTGIRYDDLEFTIDDRSAGPGDFDDSGERSFSEFSGTIGATYAVTERHSVYTTVGTAFESPTFTEFANPAGGGGFNPDLQPQEAINYEVGAKGFIGTRIRYDLALFQVDVEDELVVFDMGERDFYENSGESERRGVEASLAWDITSDLSLSAAYTYSDFAFEEFTDVNGNDFAGERIPGIPESVFFGELAWRKPGTGFAILDVQIYDELFADNANQVKVAGYGVVNGRIGVEQRLWENLLTVHVGINNILDDEFFSNVRINDFNGRFFEPAPDRNFYLGATLSL